MVTMTAVWVSPMRFSPRNYGCDRIHGTALGVGERVGNVSLDQLILNLKLMGAWNHDVSHLVQYTRLVAESTRVEIPVNYPLSGRDAFRTATGVHAAAVIKAAKQATNSLLTLFIPVFLLAGLVENKKSKSVTKVVSPTFDIGWKKETWRLMTAWQISFSPRPNP